MRRYTIRINQTTHTLDVEERARDTFTVHLGDGRLVDVTLLDDRDLAQAAVAPSVEIGRPRVIPDAIPSAAPVAATPSARPAAARAAAGPSGAGRTSVRAPMPGVVLSVDVAPGNSVVRGQTLLVLEAMKMKNDLRSERDGVVARVHVGPGDQVKHGDLLVEFES